MERSQFQIAIESTPDISFGYQKGLQALRKNEKDKVKAANTRLIDGSIDIDKAVSNLYPNENRWDYAFGYSGKVCYVEIHPACTSDVSTMKAKLQWLKEWLKNKAPLLDAIPKAAPAYVWIPTKGVSILPQSTQAKRVSTLGIKITSVHKLR